MYKQSSIALLLTVALLGGCKTLDSVSNIVSSDSATPEQIQAAYSKAEAAYLEAQRAIALSAEESLVEYDSERTAKANKLWQSLQGDFAELRANPGESLDSASLFSSDTKADEVMASSQEIVSLLAAAHSAKQAIVSVLEPIRSHFAVLDKLETPRHFERRYERVKRRHLELKEMLVAGKRALVEGSLPEFQSQLHALEQDAAEHYFLGKVLGGVKRLASSDKVEVLPTVFQDVKVTTESAREFIRQNVRAYDDIKHTVNLAELQIKRLEQLFSEHLRRKTAVEDKRVEAQLLTLETQLFQMTQKAGLGDLRHLSFSEQLAAINNKL
ncbi:MULTISPECIES: hypothetical protein [unclassified Pseudoalteromonas]|uniref:hypothetical protein n=1 Tax=unclassified Pseudoalteromonas TaxID=194690 RepID=UPI002096C917|nr:hypothetical protein [Pseudoalteromonas sp. XMcav2-N]MCO7189919.1 hypothetical protein [Pseudoalteromonas sp. XMcav2-N]